MASPVASGRTWLVVALFLNICYLAWRYLWSSPALFPVMGIVAVLSLILSILGALLLAGEAKYPIALRLLLVLGLFVPFLNALVCLALILKSRPHAQPH